MKQRSGFVSNSSSSSFVCCICDRSETGMDISLTDIDMMCCVNGHNVCSDEMIEEVPSEENLEHNYEIAEKYCPVCQFIESSNDDIAAYLLKETKIPRDEAFVEVKKVVRRRKKLYNSEYVMYACQKANIDGNSILPTIKEKFKTYSEFKKYIKG